MTPVLKQRMNVIDYVDYINALICLVCVDVSQFLHSSQIMVAPTPWFAECVYLVTGCQMCVISDSLYSLHSSPSISDNYSKKSSLEQT